MTSSIRFAGATLVLPDRLIPEGQLVVENGRVADVSPAKLPGGRDLHGHFIVPGFIDVHVHGVARIDTLDGAGAVGRIAERLPRFGVTAFCPTSIACPPAELKGMLDDVRAAREAAVAAHARVLPAHLESNFINPEFKGAQPGSCIRKPHELPEGEFSGRDILDQIAAARPDVGIITLAPEIEGVLDLIPELVQNGHRVSLGHSGASYDEARAAILAGATHATHLFNRMPPFSHRQPGLAGAVLESDEIAAEIVCDGVHVHPAVVRTAVAAKGTAKVMAITDGTAAAGLRPGERASLGGRSITAGDAAYLDDGTLAGSVLTMDRAFAILVKRMGLSLIEAAQMCATTPARELGLHGCGCIAPESVADFVVLDGELNVVETYIGGLRAWPR